jgi:LytS/YehU family sensor histidine kinase
VLSVVLSLVVKMMARWVKIEADKEKAEKMHLEAELIHLQYQLQPHFFFNALNNIYALIDKSPADAKSALHGLGKLMRYLLYETNNEQVSLATEIEFLIKYIRLMELRLTPNILVEYDFPENGEAYQVAPLLFIPLIENAFKHGISPLEAGGLFFKMEVNKNQLSFVSANPNVPKDDSDKSGSGIGIDNLKKRLELIYPGKYRFTAGVENTRYTTTLVINFN